MKYALHRLIALVITAAAMVLTPVMATEEEEQTIRARADEIATMLDDASGAATGPEEFWRRWSQSPQGSAAIQAAENVLKSQPPVATEELYKEFYENGNRSHYQSVFSALENRFITLTIAEKLENKGRFIEQLNAELDSFCDLKSWVLPAHDKEGKVFDGETIYSDLGSTLAAANVAISINLLEEKLDPKVVEKARREVEKRVLEPYERAVKNAFSGMWWMRTENNWNAVCHAGTVVAALNVVESRERRAFFIAGAEFFSERDFFKGFTDDGYCSEGMGYWNYGFGHYLYLGAAIRVATHGKVDMFRFPKVHAVLDFAPNLEIDAGNCAVFADCSLGARPEPLFVGYLSRLKGYGYTEYEARALGKNYRFTRLVESTTIGYDVDVVFDETEGETAKYQPPIRTEFADAGVFICRPAADASGKYFAIAFKGGNNGELHNHNDVGSYSLLFGDKKTDAQPRYVVRDPGGEVYTARTFSSRRYEGQLLNSYGHPVPRIAGELQSAGRNSRGVVVEKSLDDAQDRVTFDITTAYPAVKTLNKALRTFLFTRAKGDVQGEVVITDEAVFKEGEKGSFETALITFEKEIDVQKTDDGAFELRLADSVVRVSAEDAGGAPLEIVVEKSIVGENDDSVPNKPTRLALRVKDDVESAKIVQRFSAE